MTVLYVDADACPVKDQVYRVAARYRVPEESFHAEPGSLEWFLTERYRLFSADSSAEMHHDRWLLSPAEAEVELTSIVPFRGAFVARICRCSTWLNAP